MNIAYENIDRQFLERLHRLETSTVQEICEEFGVTATAIRQRLSRLQSLGLVGRDVVRTGRGRPHHTYYVTAAGLRALGENYAELATVLWSELRNIEEPSIRDRIAGRIQDAFVSRFGPVMPSASLSERMDQLSAALVERGYQVEVDASGPLPILRERNCPYPDLAESDPDVCRMEEAVFERILGADVSLKRCCRDGHHCCEFHVTEQ